MTLPDADLSFLQEQSAKLDDAELDRLLQIVRDSAMTWWR